MYLRANDISANSPKDSLYVLSLNHSPSCDKCWKSCWHLPSIRRYKTLWSSQLPCKTTSRSDLLPFSGCLIVTVTDESSYFSISTPRKERVSVESLILDVTLRGVVRTPLFPLCFLVFSSISILANITSVRPI